LPLKRKVVSTTVPLSASIEEDRDFLKGEKKFQCPNCGADGAKKAKDGTVSCPTCSCCKKNHLVAAVAPSGKKIVLARNRIQNLSEVERALPQKIEAGQDWPSPREAQVLGYHKKRGISSPLYEKVRAKYPNW
jgi:uncharacterized Zn finger protein (UPF0148 family)